MCKHGLCKLSFRMNVYSMCPGICYTSDLLGQLLNVFYYEVNKSLYKVITNN